MFVEFNRDECLSIFCSEQDHDTCGTSVDQEDISLNILSPEAEKDIKKTSVSNIDRSNYGSTGTTEHEINLIKPETPALCISTSDICSQKAGGDGSTNESNSNKRNSVETMSTLEASGYINELLEQCDTATASDMDNVTLQQSDLNRNGNEENSVVTDSGLKKTTDLLNHLSLDPSRSKSPVPEQQYLPNDCSEGMESLNINEIENTGQEDMEMSYL